MQIRLSIKFALHSFEGALEAMKENRKRQFASEKIQNSRALTAGKEFRNLLQRNTLEGNECASTMLQLDGQT